MTFLFGQDYVSVDWHSHFSRESGIICWFTVSLVLSYHLNSKCICLLLLILSLLFSWNLTFKFQTSCLYPSAYTHVLNNFSMVKIFSDIVRNLKKVYNFFQLDFFCACHYCVQYHTYIIACGFNFEALCLIDDVKKYLVIQYCLSVLFSYSDGMIYRLMHRKQLEEQGSLHILSQMLPQPRRPSCSMPKYWERRWWTLLSLWAEFWLKMCLLKILFLRFLPPLRMVMLCWQVMEQENDKFAAPVLQELM